jgi:hypothetical protein
MAVPNLSSGERQDLYRSLFLINRSFHFIVQRISDLENAKKLKTQHFEELRGLAQEVQLHINNRLLEEMHTVERADWYGFGRIRKAMEKRHNPGRK